MQKPWCHSLFQADEILSKNQDVCEMKDLDSAGLEKRLVA
jgi:hypothetical protein